MHLSSFSQTYAQARQQFLASCAAHQLPVESHIHPLAGRDGEQLAIDVARSGPANARNLLVISSGCHGVEGFCGSAVQIDLLTDPQWATLTRNDDLAVLYIHALNPYGFSWLRRVTHENVDLNRNFQDFSQPLPDNPDYRAIAELLVPAQWPPALSNPLRLRLHALRHGRKALQSAISRGQHSDPRGLFCAGNASTWSNQQLRQILRQHGQQCRRIGWIDVHTGLGPSGVGERIYKGRADHTDIARARAWWGAGLTNSFDGSSSSAQLNGTLDWAAMGECPQAEYTGMTLEYGTLPGPKVLKALRAEQWLENQSSPAPALRARIKQQLRDAFYVDNDGWKIRVLQQAREAMQQAVAGLRSH